MRDGLTRSVPWFTNRRLTIDALLDRNLAQQLEVAEHLARAQHHAAQRIVGDRNRQPGFFANALVEILQQRAAAGQHDAAIADVGAKVPAACAPAPRESRS